MIAKLDYEPGNCNAILELDSAQGGAYIVALGMDEVEALGKMCAEYLHRVDRPDTCPDCQQEHPVEEFVLHIHLMGQTDCNSLCDGLPLIVPDEVDG